MGVPGQGAVSFDVLGPIRAGCDGVELALPPGRLRWLLAVLLLHEGDEVSDEHLLTHAWGPAEVSRGALFTAASRLRSWLGPTGATLTNEGSGYRLTAPASSVDASRFRAVWVSAQTLPEPQRLDRMREALRWWRGLPLSGAPDWVRADRAVDALLRLRRDFVLGFAELAAGLGCPESALDPIADLCADSPFDEPAHAAHIRLLAACRRPAQALHQHESIRTRLREELGVSPGAEVQDAHQAVLALDRTPLSPARLVPAQLPNDLPVFAGRSAQLVRLDKLLVDSAGSRTPAVVTIAGAAGIGKSSLAVHWAHLVADRYPDGQLYLNLRGFDPTGPPMPISCAVRSLLDALTEPDRIPAGIEAQIGLYRSLLAGRQVLVLLDNARDSEQVRPLLPGSPGSMAIATSRHQMAGLIALDGANPLTLDLLAPDEARTLIMQRIGRDRAMADPLALDDIVNSCAGLPLALAVVAAHAAANPDFALADLSRHLHDATHRLDRLTAGDQISDVRAAFSWSYRALRPDPARLFRYLGGHPGPHVTAGDAASLLGVATQDVAPMLDDLARLHLVQQPRSGRYVVHDLLRAYAKELLDTTDNEQDRSAARIRLLDHYLHSAIGAAHQLDPHQYLPSAPAAAGVTIEALTSQADALAWFSSERSALAAAVRWAADNGHDNHAWQLARAQQAFFDCQGRWPVWVDVARTAVEAADRSGEALARSLAHRGLGTALTRQGSFADAYDHCVLALELSRSIGDRFGQSTVESTIARLLERQGRFAEALPHVKNALELLPIDGETANGGILVRMLNLAGWLHAQVGEYEQALTYCEHALAKMPGFGTVNDEACTLDSIAYARQQLGDRTGAIAGYRRAIDLLHTIGNRNIEAEVLANLADCYHVDGQLDAARETGQRALAMFAEVGNPRLAELRARLAWAAPAPAVRR